MRAQYPLILRGKKRGVFVIRRHNDAVAFETAEVFGKSQRHSWAAARIRRVSDHVLLEFGNECDARVFNAPDLFGKLPRARHQCWFRVDYPSIDAILRASGAQMRQAAAIFDTTEEQRGSIRQPGCASVKHAVDRVGPIFSRKDWVAWMARQEWRVVWIFDFQRAWLRQ